MLRVSFWASVVVCYGLAIFPLPVPELGPQPDKINHLLAFAVLAVLCTLSYAASSTVRIGLWLASYGLLIEATQLLPALNRNADVADWAADLIGVMIGLGAAQAMRACGIQLVRPPVSKKSR